jgi:peptidoglycan hydrolase CwlO-like protein
MKAAQRWDWSEIFSRIKTVTARPTVTEGEVIPLRSRSSYREQENQIAEVMRQIANVQNSIVQTQTERSEIEREIKSAMDAVQAKGEELIGENLQEAAALTERLVSLQAVLADLIRPSGLKVEVPR